jgi:cobalt/nickel transport system permease protein
MIELFSDIFTNRENALMETDARIKLIVALFAILLAILSEGPKFSAVLFLVAVFILFALRLPWKHVFARFLVPFGTITVLGVLQLFMTDGYAIFSIQLPHFALTATREGFLNTIHIGARILGAVGMVVVLGVITPAHDVFRALLWLRVPRTWVEVAMLMYRYIFVLLEITMDMATAQKLRLGYSGTAMSLKSAGALTGAVILRSIDQSERTSEAMLLRGYVGELPVGRMAPFTFRIGLITAAICTALLGIFAAFNGVTK